MKTPEYFPHDFSARNDKKIIMLCSRYGAAGGFVYWCLVEILHEEESNKIKDDEVLLNMLAVQSWTKKPRLKEIITECIEIGLLKNDDGFIYSERVKANVLERINRQIKYKEAGSKGGKTAATNRSKVVASSDATTTLKQSQSGGLPLKEGKGKGEKGKKKGKILKETLSIGKIESENSQTISQSHLDFFLKESGIKNKNASKFLNNTGWFIKKEAELNIPKKHLEEAAMAFLIHIRDRDVLEGKLAADYYTHFVSWLKANNYRQRSQTAIYTPNADDR